eukprot:10956804-Ditylum_brightwellii.AAC.1
MLSKEEILQSKGGVRFLYDWEVRALTLLHKKLSSPKDMLSKEEILQREGDGRLSYDGEVRALTLIHKKPSSTKDMLPRKRYFRARVV